MARLIDANSILDDFLKRYTEMERDGKLVFAACEIKQDFADMISDATTVDAVPVVRCKDCKYGEVDDADLPTQYLCNYHGADWNDENHFCSYGERMDDDKND